MAAGFGAGFATITIMAVLVLLALGSSLATVAAVLLHRRSGRVPVGLQYLLVAIGVLGVGVLVFAVVAMSDEAPAAAGLFAVLGLVPLLVGGGFLARTTGAGRLEVATTTVMAWGPPFLLGVLVTVGVMNGIRAGLDLAIGEARRWGLPWLAAASGGLVVVAGLLPLGTRLASIWR